VSDPGGAAASDAIIAAVLIQPGLELPNQVLHPPKLMPDAYKGKAGHLVEGLSPQPLGAEEKPGKERCHQKAHGVGKVFERGGLLAEELEQ